MAVAGRLLEHVFSYLTLAELNEAAAVSRRWLGIAADVATKPERRKEAEQTYASLCENGGVGWLQLLEPNGSMYEAARLLAIAAGNLAVAKWLAARHPPDSAGISMP